MGHFGFLFLINLSTVHFTFYAFTGFGSYPETYTSDILYIIQSVMIPIIQHYKPLCSQTTIIMMSTLAFEKNNWHQRWNSSDLFTVA